MGSSSVPKICGNYYVKYRFDTRSPLITAEFE
jgi:hypothetical protein